jgi:tRNA(fMet)-specific endonuclease VapC
MILDTNALSAAAENDPVVIALLADAEELALPVVVLGEFRSGTARSRYGAQYSKWLDRLITDCIVLDINEATTHHYAAISLELKQIGRPIPTNDLWIAALCRQHRFPLLSRDHHFDVVVGTRRISW